MLSGGINEQSPSYAMIQASPTVTRKDSLRVSQGPKRSDTSHELIYRLIGIRLSQSSQQRYYANVFGLFRAHNGMRAICAAVGGYRMKINQQLCAGKDRSWLIDVAM